jgi:hypothetical protein
VIVQLAVLGGAIDLVVDRTRAGGLTGFLLVATSAIALILACFPATSAYVRGRPRRRLRQRARRRAEARASDVAESESSTAP